MGSGGSQAKVSLVDVYQGSRLLIARLDTGRDADFQTVMTTDERVTQPVRLRFYTWVQHFADNLDAPAGFIDDLGSLRIQNYGVGLKEFRIRTGSNYWRFVWFYPPKGMDPGALILAQTFYKTDKKFPSLQRSQASRYFEDYLRMRGQVGETR